MTEAALERAIAEDEDERDLEPDWTRAGLILPPPRQSVHLRLEPEVVDFFKVGAKGHVTRMQAVLRAYGRCSETSSRGAARSISWRGMTRSRRLRYAPGAQLNHRHHLLLSA